MNIKELRRELEKSFYNVEKIRNKRMLNFERTQPSCTKLKDIMVSGSPIYNDTFLLYCIKDEDLDREYELAIMKYENDLKAYNNELKFLSKYDEFIAIDFLFNDLNWTWDKIDKFLGLGKDYARKKYAKSLQQQKERTN